MKLLNREDPNNLNIVENVSEPFSSHVKDVIDDPQMLWRGFSYGSVVGTITDYLTNTKQYEPDTEYDVHKDPRLFKYRTFIPKYFSHSVSAKHTTDLLVDFEQHQQDVNNPIYHIASLTGELSDPSNWIFGSGLIKGAKTAVNFKKAGSELTKFSKLMVGEEAVKQMYNEHRQYEDALVVGGFAWYLNKLGKKFLTYEDGNKIFQEMKFYENASNTEMPSIISKPTSDAMYAKQAQNIEDALTTIKSEFPDLIINRGKGVGKTVKGVYVPAYIRRNQDLIAAEMFIDDEGIKQMYKQGRYLKSRIPGVIPFRKGDFANEGEFLEFVIRHELAHVRIPRDPQETKAEYENRINKIAYNQILENRTGNVSREGSIFVDQQVIDNARRISEIRYRNKINPNITDKQLKYIKTGTFLETLGYNPMDRLINVGSRTVTEFALNVFKSPLYIEANKLNYGEMPDSAEAIKGVVYTPMLKDFTDKLEEAYADYLKSHGINKMDLGKKIKQKLIQDPKILTYQQFKNAPVYAILRGYRYPEIPQIEAVAREFAKFVKPFADKIEQTGLYLIKPDKEYEFFKRALDSLEVYLDPKSQLFNPTKEFRYTYPRTGQKVVYTYDQLKDKVESLEKLINDVKTSGTRKNYFTVMWNFEMIEKNFDTFYKDVYPLVLKNSDEKFAKKIMDNFKNYRPYEEPEELMEGVLPGDEFIFKEPSYSKYLRARNIPLKDVDYEFLLDKGYIESDIEMIASTYFKSVVPDIVLTEKFGDPFGFGYMYDLVPDTFAPGLRQIQKEFDEKIFGKPQVSIKQDDIPAVGLDEETWVSKSRENINVKSGKETTLTLYRGKTTELGNEYFQGNVDFGKGGGKYWGTSLEHASYYSPKITKADVTLKNPYVIEDDYDLALIALTHKLDIGGPKKVLKNFPEKIKKLFYDIMVFGEGYTELKSKNTLELQKNKKKYIDILEFNDDNIRALVFSEFMLGRRDVNEGFIAGEWAKKNGFDSIVVNPWGKEVTENNKSVRAMFDQNEVIIFPDLYKVEVSKGASLEKKKQNKVLRDAEAVIHLFKGRYGLAKNPQRFISRAYRLVKPLNSMGMLSGALAGLPDTARIITYNGLKRAIPRLLQMLNISVTSEVFKKANKQANRAGQAIEFMLDHGRANQVYGSHHDTFATFNNVDRFIQSASAFNFKYVNQMATWTWMAKTAASSDIGTEIIEASMRFVNGKATSKDMMKFRHAGVSPGEIKDIVDCFKKYGYGKGGVDFNESYDLLKFANTEKWIENPKEINAAFRFNRMLNETIDYVVVAPTLGDTPLWASKELGAVIGQFKKFIFAFDRKVMQRGLQERDLSFITQMAALLFFGMFVDGVRSQQLGKDYSKKDIRDKIYDGFERSGAGGIFLETNRMLETLTDNRIGIRPFIGVGKPYGTSLAWKAGVLGPTASQLATISQIMYDWGRGKHTHHTARRIRKLVPFNNIWYLDSIFDKLEKGIR